MNQPTIQVPGRVARDTTALTAHLPLPGMGILPVNAFVIHGRQPVLVDTGIPALEGDLVAALEGQLDLNDLTWIWITHADPDHVGALPRLLARAPRAKVVTTFLGMGKMGFHDLVSPDRVHLLNPGQRLDVGDRELLAVKPPIYDAPETTGLFDTATRTLFSSDCFGAVLEAPVTDAREVHPDRLRDGLVTWSTVDSPWLSAVAPDALDRALKQVLDLDPEVVLGAHLPAAPGMIRTLAEHLADARTAPPFVGPDQQAMMAMMADAAQ